MWRKRLAVKGRGIVAAHSFVNAVETAALNSQLLKFPMHSFVIVGVDWYYLLLILILVVLLSVVGGASRGRIFICSKWKGFIYGRKQLFSNVHLSITLIKRNIIAVVNPWSNPCIVFKKGWILKGRNVSLNNSGEKGEQMIRFLNTCQN